MGRTQPNVRQLALRRDADALRRNAYALRRTAAADRDAAAETTADREAAAETARVRAAIRQERDTAAHVVERANAPEAVRIVRRERNTAARATARDDETLADKNARLRQLATARAAKHAADNDGPLYLAAPANMPSDAYLNTHERNPTAMIVSARRTLLTPCPPNTHTPSPCRRISGHARVTGSSATGVTSTFRA